MSGIVGLLDVEAAVLERAAAPLARAGARVRAPQVAGTAGVARVVADGWPDDSRASADGGPVAVCHGTLHDLPPGRSPAEHLLAAYREGSLPRCLARANGVFSLTLLDPVRRCVVLATDRYGIAPLYLWRSGGRLRGWASEPKAFLAVPGCDARPDPDAARCLLRFGHLLGDATWLREVRRAAPASLYTVPMDGAEPEHRHRYWSWSDVPARRLALPEAVEELGPLFRRAVARRLEGAGRVSVLLSGGLDSRALLAAASEETDVELAAFTFGRADSADALLARRVAGIAGVPHTVCELDESSWLAGRAEGVWRTDGMFTLLHMHALVAVDRIAAHSPVILNGFAGDLVCGGSYLRDGLDRRIDEATARRHFGEFVDPEALADPWLDVACTDPYFLQHRVMRFTAAGSDLLSDRLVHRKPFFDVDLMDFLYGLPDAHRQHARLYGRMLRREFPAWFRDVPWEATGLPVGRERTLRARVARRCRRAWRGLAGRSAPGGYTDYARWLRSPEAWRRLGPALERGRKQLAALGVEDRLDEWRDAHERGVADHSEAMAAFATAALWLDRAFPGDPGEEPPS